ncbi:DCD (Development and Cell Death) domain protein [Abeliophyllum distichum]|uniref:DCD (Development and Cell Death) domain protein n=1 Tax=Abeliophyllum distichum TaxID=126358 RepID=A0ABD1TD04_9LAMI
MVAARNKKKGIVAAESTSEEVVSNKKIPKNKKKGGNAQVVSDKKSVENKRKGANAVESASIVGVSNEKPPRALEPDPQIAGKSSIQNSAPGKEAGTVSEVQAIQSNKRKRTNEGVEEGNNDKKDIKDASSHRGKEKRGIINEKNEDTKKRGEKSRKNLGGVIFMCNTKTKPDCFRYHVMGISASRKEFVMGIKPGLKLFLFDFDLKLLYGIYEASSAGGMKLEPAAFGGAFPAQVRFTVHRDCLPLPENIFKKAIKDNYDERTHKFRTELTTSQVKHLTSLFQPTPRLHSNGKSLVRGSEPTPLPMPAPNVLPTAILHTEEKFKRHGSSKPGEDIILFDQEKKFSEHHVSSTDVPPQKPLFLTEQEYRNYGLRQGSHLLPTAVGGTVGRTLPGNLEQEQDRFQRNPASTNNNFTLQQREVSRPETFFPSEKEYRTYGLRGPREVSTEVSPMIRTNQAVEDAYNPYHESTTSLVNRYLSLPPMNVVSPAGLRPSINYPNSTGSAAVHLGRIIPDGERSFSSYAPRELSEYNQRPHLSHASREPSEYNQRYHLLGGETKTVPTTVSHRYSFGGPSVSRR